MELAENILAKRLATVADLTEEDRAQLDQLSRNVRTVRAKEDITSEGDRPEQIQLIMKGWAARYMVLKEGARQIVAFLIPGDFADLNVAVLDRMDHGIVALSPCKVAYIDSEELDRITSENPRLTKALLWSTLVDEAVLRQWIVNVGAGAMPTKGSRTFSARYMRVWKWSNLRTMIVWHCRSPRTISRMPRD